MKSQGNPVKVRKFYSIWRKPGKVRKFYSTWKSQEILFNLEKSENVTIEPLNCSSSLKILIILHPRAPLIVIETRWRKKNYREKHIFTRNTLEKSGISQEILRSETLKRQEKVRKL